MHTQVVNFTYNLNPVNQNLHINERDILGEFLLKTGLLLPSCSGFSLKSSNIVCTGRLPTLTFFRFAGTHCFLVCTLAKKNHCTYLIILSIIIFSVIGQLLGRPRCRWVDNIKIDLRAVGWDGMDWIDLAQDRDQWRVLVNTVMNLQVT
jgi:hypothetical protein